MTRSATFRAAVIAGSLALLPAFSHAQTPAGDLATLVKAWLALGHPPDWDGIDALPGVRWAAPQPTSLTTCLPDGSCYTRQGTATMGGRSMQVVAAGARTMVMKLLVRNAAAPVGEDAALAALRQGGLTPDLARCPVRGGAGTTNWYRVRGGSSPGVLSIQTVRGARPSEGFIIQAGEDLPQLVGNQGSMYTEQCAPGAAQTPVASVPPVQRLAEVVVAYLLPASTAALSWSALTALPTGVTWDPAGAKPINLSIRNDPNPLGQTGIAEYSGRRFSVLASGTTAQVKTIYMEELGVRHPRGEHMLGIVYTKGIAVRLVRCGPVYTESTNNWYSLQSPRTRPAMIRQSISYEGNNVLDMYELRLDGTLPPRDPRDREPGVSGCQ